MRGSPKALLKKQEITALHRAALAGCVCFFVLAALPPPAWAFHSSWLEVTTPHFIVASNSPAAQARLVAEQLERVRAVFQKAFPGMRLYPDVPVVVLVPADQATFADLEPKTWLEQGAVGRQGMFYRGPDVNYVLVLIGAAGDDRYRVVYHEFSHLMLEDNYKSIPLWLNEGLAQFYANMEIEGNNVRLGLPSQYDLELLRLNRLLPLPTLFAVGHSSPYYNEAGLGTMFYAQSWALTDYLMFKNGAPGRGPIDAYLELTAQGLDPVDAAAKAFGNLDQLQTALQNFVRHSAFHYYRLKAPMRLRRGDLRTAELSPARSEALRGDFLTRMGRLGEARRLLESALAADPHLPGALQSMGLLDLRSGQEQAAMTLFAQAASEPDCYLARFYLALTLIHSRPDAAKREEIREDLNGFIRFNPTFAPAYAALAEFEAEQGTDLGAARQLASRAIQLDSHNVQYYVLEGEILAKMGDFSGALRAAQRAVDEAQSARDKSAAYVFLGRLQETQKTSPASK